MKCRTARVVVGVAVILAGGGAAWGGTRISAPLPENVAATLGEAEEDVFWRDVTVRLDGALPNDNPKLDDELELYLGRLDDGTWRKYVLGFSAFYDPRRGKQGRTLYNWMDDEGVLTEVTEDGEKLRLVVDMTVHPDHWTPGGTVRAVIDAVREGEKLTGTFAGSFHRAGSSGKTATRGTVRGTIRSKRLPSPVTGHVPLQPGEHPRLLFRASDLPALRKRLETAEGKAIFTRLKAIAAGKPGTWHGYTLGLLHQLTGEAKWAEQARAFAEGVIAGKIKTRRYGWTTRDGGYMRVGPSAAAVAAAYDLCYPAWPAEFRQWVARKIQARVYPNMVLEHDRGESDAQFTQRSNHYGLWQGGAGTCVVAIKGDPGTEEGILRRSHRVFRRRLKRGLIDGFGDHGWFYEGTFCGRFPTTGGFNPYLHALRVAEGKDFVTNCSEARWLTTKWIYEMVRTGGKVTYHSRGMYSKLKWDGLTGDFAQGFGLAPLKHRPSILWFYQRVLEPGGVRDYGIGEGDKAAMNAAYAFVNWPIGLAPADPAEALGHALWDREAGFFVFRSGWAGEGDVVVSMHGEAVVLGMGLKATFGAGIPPEADVTYFREGRDKTIVVAAVQPAPGGAGKHAYHLAVDFSGMCGAPVLLVGTTGPAAPEPKAERPAAGKSAGDREELAALLAGMRRPAGAGGGEGRARAVTVRMGGRTWRVMTVQKGPAPEVQVLAAGEAEALAVGKRRIRFHSGDPAHIILGE